MKLRKLEQGDAPLMLEWMHDENVVANMGTDFQSKTIEDCHRFIDSASRDKCNLHLAIVNDANEYMGTVSLKHIGADGCAEFAITVRACAMGKGYSKWGMNEIIRIGMEEQSLKRIVWCVSKNNGRAVHFYDKNGYPNITDIPKRILECYTDTSLAWYGVENKE